MVETYGSGKDIADALGYNFHLIAPKGTALNDKGTNLSIFSKFPFESPTRIFYGFISLWTKPIEWRLSRLSINYSPI